MREMSCHSTIILCESFKNDGGKHLEMTMAEEGMVSKIHFLKNPFF